jgi:hypothetical protein
VKRSAWFLVAVGMMGLVPIAGQGQQARGRPLDQATQDAVAQAEKECPQDKVDLVHAWAEGLAANAGSASEELAKLSWDDLEQRSSLARSCSLAMLWSHGWNKPGMKMSQEDPQVLAYYLEADQVTLAVRREQLRRYADFLARHKLSNKFLAENPSGKR